MEANIQPVPAAAKWLGVLGVLPFAGLAAVGPFLDPTWQPGLSRALVGYGAVILSFLGGVQWGLVAADRATDARREAIDRYIVSILPSLLAWGALLMPHPVGLWALLPAFAWVLVIDLRASTKGFAPAWYPRLRIPLTIAVMISLAAGATAF